jgi:hypothetical protein
MKLALLALCGLSFLVAADERGPRADLQVVISARGPASKRPVRPFAAKAQFIDAVVTNVGTKPRTIIAWTQFGWSWVSNSAQVSPGIEALKNAPETIVLEPGKSFRRPVEVYVVGARPVTFRLGFYATADVPISARVPPLPSSELSWSNALTIR